MESPSLKKLHQFRDDIGDDWFDLGVQLLNEDDVGKLKILKKDYPSNASRCCSEMFQLWLERCPSPKWEDLITALNSIGRKSLAKKIKNKFSSMYYV